jgi:hypothetical protein
MHIAENGIVSWELLHLFRFGNGCYFLGTKLRIAETVTNATMLQKVDTKNCHSSQKDNEVIVQLRNHPTQIFLRPFSSFWKDRFILGSPEIFFFFRSLAFRYDLIRFDSIFRNDCSKESNDFENFALSVWMHVLTCSFLFCNFLDRNIFTESVSN